MESLDNNIVNSKLKNWKELNRALEKLFSPGSLPVNVGGLGGSLPAFFTASLSRRLVSQRVMASQYGTRAQAGKALDFLIVLPSESDIGGLLQDLKCAIPEAEFFTLPWWGMIPYRAAPVGSAVFGERAAFLSELALRDPSSLNTRPRFFICSLRSFLSPTVSPEYIKKLSRTVKKGESIDTQKLCAHLSKSGYLRVPRVSVPGEFALRGEVLDIVLPGKDSGIRIIFDFDRIEKIRTFDLESQSTTGEVERVLIFPMKEVLFDAEMTEILREKCREYDENCIKNNTSSESFENEVIKNNTSLDSFEENGVFLPWTDEAKEKLLRMTEELKTAGSTEGEELFYPLMFSSSLLDYLLPESFVIYLDYDRSLNSRESLLREWSAMYRKARLTEPVLPVQRMQYDFEALIRRHPASIMLRSLKARDESPAAPENYIQFHSEPGRSFLGNINYLKEQLSALKAGGYSVVIFTDNENQNLRIKEILSDVMDDSITLVPQAVSQGFSIPEIKLLVIQENEIFGRRRHLPKSTKTAKSRAIDTFVELQTGDFVVHVNYGIGKFLGIERVKNTRMERDFIKLEYADGDFAFVPIEQANLIQRYIGSEGEKPHLDRIGSKAWENRKNRVKAAVEELAQKLIDLYSRRKTSRGFAFPKDTEWQTAFEAAFPYEDTPDQITVTKEIKEDMEKPVPMDRLVCGDVGYGKTEIAMRAAFKAVLGGKQVAFMAPTTILAEQHYETCLERFKNFPVTVAMLSRFVSLSEQKKIIERIRLGEVDIVIGTHRIIQKDIQFKNLGLMIIDEEQRFGVKDKERLKVMKNNIDCLALSATPIPRTLHMSFLKIRDMSLLTTPPQNRQAIETVVEAYDDQRVARAIREEVSRGGQIFYLHNRVETLEETRLKLERLVPEMLIDCAHGQMSVDELDDIFRRFKNGGFHILVATTIIENGIDIPNVNTIIIDRADMYGVSQLYQLRGRVGRSDRKAYAYLFYPENKSLNEVAMKRLQVISDFTELGSGFKIAMKDLEIRGAGNLLGRDQSGNVYSVGFDLYLRLLNEAVERLTAQKEYVPQSEVLLELEYSGFIPDSYIINPQTKMEVYKKIAGIISREELEGVYLELEDRFGPIPEDVVNLLTLAEIRVIAGKLFITAIKEKAGVARIEFGKVSGINVDRLMAVIKDTPGVIKLDPKAPNVINIQTGKIGLKEKGDFLCQLLERLA